MIDSIRPILTTALNTHFGIVTRANEVKKGANATLKETVASLWMTHKTSATPAAFRACVIQIAVDAGYTDGKQWGTKILVSIDKVAFAQRATRSNKGVKAGANARTAGVVAPLTAAQVKSEVELIKRLAPAIKLTSVQLEAIVLAITNR